MDTMAKSIQTTLMSLLCFYFILTLKCVTLVSESWYVLVIDLNKCSNCGRIIVTMGTLLEQDFGAFEDNAEVKDVSKETAFQRYLNNLVHGMDEGGGKESNDDYDTMFRIENQINMYVGLWKSLLCTEDGVYCVDLDIDTSPNVFTSLPMLSEIQENIKVARQFFLLSTVIVVLTTVFATFNFTVSVSTTSLIMSVGGLISAFVSLVGVVIVSLTFFSALGMSDVVTLRIPLMLILTLLNDYMTLAAVFTVWRTWETFNKSSVQNWFERNTRNV